MYELASGTFPRTTLPEPRGQRSLLPEYYTPFFWYWPLNLLLTASVSIPRGPTNKVLRGENSHAA